MNSQSIDPVILSQVAKKLLRDPLAMKEFSARVYEKLQADLKLQAIRDGRYNR
ncbi:MULTISPECIES: hypothetical protein [Leptolyngbya]|uniref:hypothetical protein n=1 Tax=Leptolyngbya TaxID=47251 RepID=UPI00168551C8|nr:hypothetical protein [Leptolyngbya sp. FACHB-1624]MBD1859856.1 hypothetical protein [Leptolyngbya sp. FACHB-1624]